MKKLFCFFFFSCCFGAFGQQKIYELVKGAQAANVATNSFSSLFQIRKNITSFNLNHFKNQSEVLEMVISKNSLHEILLKKPELMELEIPNLDGSTMTLVLIPIDIFGRNYRVLNSKNLEVEVPKGLHYQGVVKHDPTSVVSFSFTENEASGIISNNKGNFIVGKVKNSNYFTMYNDKNLSISSNFMCGVKDSEFKKDLDHLRKIAQDEILNVACDTVEIYLEADSAIWVGQGKNMAATISFVNTLFNQVAVLYNNEQLKIKISELKIWDMPDPYRYTSTTSNMLAAFKSEVGTTFNGRLAHLISGRDLNGGIAYVDVLCKKDWAVAISASISNTVVSLPTYSWNVMVIAHELGHNFGSPHTQSCSWPGGALDNCFTTEGGCSYGPAPTNGGTIMSYCHLKSYGINFNNGFGPLPGNLIRERTQSCLGSPTAPTDLATLEIYSTKVVLGWDHEAYNFIVEYKPVGTGTWNTISSAGRTTEITGLTANTVYEWRVKSSCSSYSNSTFTTNNLAPISYCNVSFTTGCGRGSLIGIKDFVVNNENWNPSSGCTEGGYSLISSPVHSLIKDSTYNFTIYPHYNRYNFYAAVWIDYDKNGTFDISERVLYTGNRYSPISGSFTVPSTVTSQSKTRMRVILRYSSYVNDPCGTYTYGEAEDYYVNIVNCPESITLEHPGDDISTGNVTYQASALINASNQVTGSGTRVRYESPSIELEEGFIAEPGTVFVAKPGGCL